MYGFFVLFLINMGQCFYPFQQKSFRKHLRNNASDAEVLLWSGIRNRQLSGVKFRRQAGIGEYVADFYAPEIKLVIEVDGDSHFLDEERKEKDEKRSEYMRLLGLKTIRFTNVDVTKNLKGVLAEIVELIELIKRTDRHEP